MDFDDPSSKHKRNDANHTDTLVYNNFIQKLAQSTPRAPKNS